MLMIKTRLGSDVSPLLERAVGEVAGGVCDVTSSVGKENCLGARRRYRRVRPPRKANY